MPARTNDFQQLVGLIKLSLAKPGDRIETSVLEPAVGLDDPREIDILHTTSDGITRIRIAVEAKDEGRPIGVQRLEEYCGKYTGEARVRVDKFMIVSRHGFTGPAKRKAERLGVPLLTLDEARNLDWSKVAEEHANVRQSKELNFVLPPHIENIQIEPALPKDLERKIICEGQLLGPGCKPTCSHGTLPQFITREFLNGRYRHIDQALRKICEIAKTKPDGGFFEADVPLKVPLKVRFEGVYYPINGIRVQVHVVNLRAPIECTSYELTSTEGEPRLIHHLCAEAGSYRFEWAVTDGVKRGYPMRIGDPKRTEAKSESE